MSEKWLAQLLTAAIKFDRGNPFGHRIDYHRNRWCITDKTMEREKITIGKGQTAVAGTWGAVDEPGFGAMQPNAIAGPLKNLI